MSLIPPTAIILSKIKHHIKRKFEDEPNCEAILERCGPYPLFKLEAEFRSLENGTINKLDNIERYIQSEIVQWDCVDTALNMFTRMKDFLRMTIPSPGVLRLTVCHRMEGAKDDDLWSDLYLDEIPINVAGLKDENGQEMTFLKRSIT